MSEPWVPRAYMEGAVKFLVERGAAGLFLDPGLGKTAISLAAFLLLKQHGKTKRALVVAPLQAIYHVWPDELRKWTDFYELSLTTLHGPEKEARLKKNTPLYAINPEGLDWLVSQVEAGRFTPPDLLIVDESTRFKNTRTVRFKLMKQLLPYFRRRWILTGTPAPNGLLDLFGQVYILDHGAALGRFITFYRNTYFVSYGFGGYQWAPKRGAEKLIYEKLRPLILRFAAVDHLDLPPLVEQEVLIDLPPRARAAYERLAEQLILDLEAGTVIAANAAVATQKLRQLTGGSIYVEGPEERAVAYVHNEKLEALVDLLEELSGQPAMVAFEFRHQIAPLQAAAKRATGMVPPVLAGKVAPKEAAAAITAWNRGELPVLLTQPQTAAHSLNLQAGGHHLVFFGLTWDLEMYDQLIARLWRQGQKERVIVHHLLARQTIDGVMREALRKKTRTQNGLLDALKSSLIRRKR